ncbi:putative sulfate exporter family transporter, partial [Paraburkholderia sp. SIMBA_049]
ALGWWLARSARSGSASADGAHGKRKVAVPWFALGFLGFVIVNSLNVLPADVTHTLNLLDTFALTMAMTALGIETRVSQIREAGPRA